jgi:gluconate 2-dehydrogenase gamma chain
MDRRAFLENVGGGAASAFFGASLIDLRRAGAFAAVASPQQPWEFFTADQAKLLDAVSAQIVPSDGTPGAREARVVRFADHALATFMKGRGQSVTNALKALDSFSRGARGKQAFQDRASADQITVLEAFEKKDGPSFGTLRQVTMVGMFSHPEHGGNYQKIGWKLIGYEDRYSWAPPFGYYDR